MCRGDCPPPGSQTGSQRHPLKPMHRGCFPRPARGTCTGAAPVSAALAAGTAFSHVPGEGTAAHPRRALPAGRADPGGKTPGFPRGCGPEAARVEQAPLAGSAVAISQPLLCSTWANGTNGTQRTTCEQSAVMSADYDRPRLTVSRRRLSADHPFGTRLIHSSTRPGDRDAAGRPDNVVDRRTASA